MEKNEICLVAVRCNELINPIVTGSIKKKCVICKEDVWLTPASQHAKIENIKCTRCIVIHEDDNIIITPETHEEANYFLKNRRKTNE